MPNFNKCYLMGNLTKDPEIRYTPKGTSIAEFGLAVNRKIKSDDGSEPREEVTFIDITFWGQLAELAEQYLKKGRPVFIEGRLQLDTWDDKETGKKRSKLKVVGESMQFIGPRDPDAPEPAKSPQQRATTAPSTRTKPSPDPDLDQSADEIPF